MRVESPVKSEWRRVRVSLTGIMMELKSGSPSDPSPLCCRTYPGFRGAEPCTGSSTLNLKEKSSTRQPYQVLLARVPESVPEDPPYCVLFAPDWLLPPLALGQECQDFMGALI